MLAEKSTLSAKLDRVMVKRGFSLPLVEQAVLAYQEGRIAHNIMVDSITRQEFSDKLDKIRDCGTIFEIREYENQQIIHNGNYCRNPIVCPVCAERVSKRRRAIWSPRIRKAVKKYPFVYMLVNTIKDGPDLGDRLKSLVNSRKRFRLMGQRRIGSRSRGEARKIGAGTINTEIVFNESGEVHAHDHQLLFCKDMIDYQIYDREKLIQLERVYGPGKVPEGELFKIAMRYLVHEGKLIPCSKLSYEWHKATKGQGVNIKAIPLDYKTYLKNPFYKKRYIEKYEDWLVFHSIECLKYNSKLSLELEIRKITAQQYSDLLCKKGNARLFNTVGDFRNPDDSLYFDEKEIERLEYIEDIQNSEYVIRSARLNVKAGEYEMSGQLPGAIFADSDPPGERKRYRLKCQGKIMGDYRRLRSSAMKYRNLRGLDDDDFKIRLENYLDRIREAMKGMIKNIWKMELPELSFIRFAVPSCFA